MGKGQFFTIDAIVALSVLAVGIIALMVAFTGSPLRAQTALYSSDLLDYFSSTRFDKISDPSIINLWCVEGPLCTAPTHKISRAEQPLLSVLTDLVSAGEVDLARYIAQNISRQLVQPQYGWNLSIQKPGNAVLLAGQTIPGEIEQLVSTRTITYAISDNHTLEGPYVVQVDVWQ